MGFVSFYMFIISFKDLRHEGRLANVASGSAYASFEQRRSSFTYVRAGVATVALGSAYAEFGTTKASRKCVATFSPSPFLREFATSADLHVATQDDAAWHRFIAADLGICESLTPDGSFFPILQGLWRSLKKVMPQQQLAHQSIWHERTISRRWECDNLPCHTRDRKGHLSHGCEGQGKVVRLLACSSHESTAPEALGCLNGLLWRAKIGIRHGCSMSTELEGSHLGEALKSN